jgi:hypothetical protein
VERFTLVERDGGYFIDPQPSGALVAKVFTEHQPSRLSGYGRLLPERDCAYIEPCGAAPDGYWFPVWYVAPLLNQGAIAPHYYGNPEQIEAVESDGIAFDIVGETESSEEARNLRTIDRLTEGG